MRWIALGPTDAAGRTGGTIAAMGKGIEIEAMKPVEIDHVLHAGKMVPRRWDGGSGKSGGRSLERVVAFSAIRGARAIPNVELQTSFACVTLEGRRNYFAGGPRR